MKEIRPKEDKAVSPIIATILLIAITVVLAATLVTILGGFTHSASNTFGDAAANVNETSTTSGSYYTQMSITSFSGASVSNSQVTITVTLSDGASISGTLPTTSTAKTIGTSSNSVSITSSSVNFTAGSVYVLTSATGSITSIELTHDSTTIYQSGTISVA